MCSSGASPPGSTRRSAGFDREDQFTDDALFILLQVAKILATKYRIYVRRDWPKDVQALSVHQLALCIDELVLIVRNLAQIVAHLGGLAIPATPRIEVAPYQTMLSGSAVELAEVPAMLVRLSDDTRDLYLKALNLAPFGR